MAATTATTPNVDKDTLVKPSSELSTVQNSGKNVIYVEIHFINHFQVLNLHSRLNFYPMTPEILYIFHVTASGR